MAPRGWPSAWQDKLGRLVGRKSREQKLSLIVHYVILYLEVNQKLIVEIDVLMTHYIRTAQQICYQ